MADDIRWMTYTELAEALGIGPDSARNLVRRKRWPRQTGNDGLARVGVPVTHLVERLEAQGNDGAADTPADSPINPPTDSTTETLVDGGIIALEVLKEHIGRLETEISDLKDELSRERARAAQVDALTAILEIERKRSEELRQERDKWSGLVEASQRQIMDMTNKPRGLFKWLRRA